MFKLNVNAELSAKKNLMEQILTATLLIEAQLANYLSNIFFTQLRFILQVKKKAFGKLHQLACWIYLYRSNSFIHSFIHRR